MWFLPLLAIMAVVYAPVPVVLWLHYGTASRRQATRAAHLAKQEARQQEPATSGRR